MCDTDSLTERKRYIYACAQLSRIGPAIAIRTLMQKCMGGHGAWIDSYRLTKEILKGQACRPGLIPLQACLRRRRGDPRVSCEDVPLTARCLGLAVQPWEVVVLHRLHVSSSSSQERVLLSGMPSCLSSSRYYEVRDILHNCAIRTLLLRKALALILGLIGSPSRPGRGWRMRHGFD